jgi:hypothetical protein
MSNGVVMLLILLLTVLNFNHYHTFQPVHKSPRRCITTSRHSSQRQNEAVDDGRLVNRVLIFGLGNIGRLVAIKSSTIVNGTRPYFSDVLGTTRSDKKLDSIQVLNYDDSDSIRSILPTCSHVLVTVPPINIESSTKTMNVTVGKRPRIWDFFCDPILNQPNLNLRESLQPNTWVGYISSTSVYGNHDGDWVTETSTIKCIPNSKGGLYHKAENESRKAALDCGWRLHVFRCAGLYGDGRSILHTLMKLGGQDVASDGGNTTEYHTSRIHEEDVARAIIHAMCKPDSGEFCTWNLADDNPAPRSEVVAYGYNLLEKSAIQLSHNRTRMVRKPSQRDERRLIDSKKVSNQLMKTHLLPDGKLIYPTYREGLQAVLIKNKRTWSK